MEFYLFFGQNDSKLTSNPLFTVHFDAPMMNGDSMPNNGKAKSSALAWTYQSYAHRKYRKTLPPKAGVPVLPR